MLIVDDSVAYLDTARLLLNNHYTVRTASGGRMALKLLSEFAYDVVLLDIEMPDIDGFKVLEEIRKKDKRIPVIIISQHSHYETVVRALKMGADDFFDKEFDQKLLIERINQLLEQRKAYLHIDMKNDELHNEHGNLVFTSPRMRMIDDMISEYARLDWDVFLVGESGVGKDAIAYQLHNRGARRDKCLITCPLAEIPAELIASEIFGHKKGSFTDARNDKTGRIELANNSTLYLPEITDLPQTVQLMLLNFLDTKTINILGYSEGKGSKPINAKVISATNANPEDLLAHKILRQDFYFRLQTLVIRIPPLRERPEDILPLINYFSDKLRVKREQFSELTLSEELLRWLLSYSWPGNVRQLKNMITAIFSRGLVYKENPLSLKCLPENNLNAQLPDYNAYSSAHSENIQLFKDAKKEFETAYYERLIRVYNFDINKMALACGESTRTVYNHLSRLGLSNTNSSDEVR